MLIPKIYRPSERILKSFEKNQPQSPAQAGSLVTPACGQSWARSTPLWMPCAVVSFLRGLLWPAKSYSPLSDSTLIHLNKVFIGLTKEPFARQSFALVGV
jgi:hypothetical protein